MALQNWQATTATVEKEKGGYQLVTYNRLGKRLHAFHRKTREEMLNLLDGFERAVPTFEFSWKEDD